MFIRSSVTGAASPGVSGALNAKTARKMRSWRVDLPSVCQPLCRSGLEAEEPSIARPLFDPVLSNRKSKSSQWGCVANMDYARSPHRRPWYQSLPGPPITVPPPTWGVDKS